MKKASSKKRILVIIGVSALFLATITGLAIYDKATHCELVTGDGYIMGTDPEPIVIAGTCGGKPIPYDELFKPLDEYQ